MQTGMKICELVYIKKKKRTQYMSLTEGQTNTVLIKVKNKLLRHNQSRWMLSALLRGRKERVISFLGCTSGFSELCFLKVFTLCLLSTPSPPSRLFQTL